MDGSSPPSPTQTHAYSFYEHDDQKDADYKNPQSFSDMNTGRPVSGSQVHSHLTAPGLEQSYKDAPVADRSAYGGPFAVIQEGAKAPSVGDLADARKNISAPAGQSPYDDTKVPSNSDLRQINGSSSNPGGRLNTSRPISYNGNHYGRH